MRLKSLQSFRNLEDFIGVDVWVVYTDRIEQHVLGKETDRMFYSGKKRYLKSVAYFSLADAEVRFTRDTLGIIKSSQLNWLQMITMLQDIKVRRPDLFL